LAPDSRLPMWFRLAANIDRPSVTLQLDYYNDSMGSKGVFTLRDRQGQVVLKKGGYFGKSLEHSGALAAASQYPMHEVIVIDGVTDIVEHRKMEPIFYMTDDPALWGELDR
jgi:hypothetical protein